MDEDIELGRKAFQDLIQGVASLTRSVIDSNVELTPEEKAVQRDAALGVEQLLRGIVDLGALAIALNRGEEDE